MYNVSEHFNEDIIRFDRQLDINLAINGNTIEKSNLIKGTIERGVTSSNAFTIGETFSSKLTLELYKTEEVFNQGDKVDISLLLVTDVYLIEEPEAVPQGVYYIDNVTVNGAKVTIVAYDKLFGMEEEFESELSYPTTTKKVMAEITSKYGYKHDLTLEDLSIQDKLVGYSIKEIIGFIAGLQGKNAIMNVKDEISFVDFTRTDFHLTPSTYITFTKKNDYKITGATCLFGDIGINSGTQEGNVLAFKNPWCKQSDVDRIFNKFKGLTLAAADIKYIGNFALTPADIITITDVNGETYNIFLSKHTITYSGGIRGEIVSGCEDKAETDHFINKVGSKKTLTELTIEQGKINAEIVEIEKDTSSTKEKVAQLEITTENITQKIEETAASVTEVTEELASSNETIKELVTGLNKANNDIANTNSNLTGIINDLTEAENNISNLQGTTTTQSNKIASIETNINSITQKVAATESSITEITGQITGVEGNITDLSGKVETNKNNIASITTTIDGINQKVSSTEETIKTIETTSNNALNVANETKESLDSKANKTDVYTKAEVYTKTQTESAINTAKDSINLTVSETYETKTNVTKKVNAAKDEAVSSANATTTEKLKSYSTTEQMNSAIKVAKDSITNTVSQTYITKGDAESKYSTKSEVQQTSDKLVAKFSSNGGQNLIKNGKAKNGTYGWSDNGGGIKVGTSVSFGTSFNTSMPSGIRGAEIKLKNDTDYVYEAWIFSTVAIAGTSSTPLHFWCMSTSNTAGNSQLTILDYRQQIPKANTWTKCYVHFKTKATGNVYFTPFIYNGSGSHSLSVTEISLSESKVETAWTPHPSEVYEGSTVIDASGVTVNNGALRVKNNNGETVLSGDSDGNLWVQNTLSVGGSTDGSVLVKNSSGENIFSANKNGTFVKNGTMSITSGNITTSGTGYPDGNTRDMTVYAYGLDIREVDYSGSQVNKRRANYQGGHYSLTEDNSQNAGGISYRNHQTAKTISLQKTSTNDLNFNNTTINLDGNSGNIQANSIAIGNSSMTDTVNNSPWYGVGMSNIVWNGGNAVQLAGYYGLRLRAANTYLNMYNSTGSRLLYGNGIGALEMGALNTSYMHFSTDRPSFYFYQTVEGQGNFKTNDTSSISGFLGYRGGGHFRIAPSNEKGSITFEQFYPESSTSSGLKLHINSWYLRPNGNDGGILGTSSVRWQQAYITNGVTTGSDSKLKENIKIIPREVVLNDIDSSVTALDFYNYLKGSRTYTFNYRGIDRNQLGILADDIPQTVFNAIGLMSKTEEQYLKEMEEKERCIELLKSLPSLLDEGEDNLNKIVDEETNLTLKEVKEIAESEVQEPVRLINSQSHTALLQEVLSLTISKVEILEQENKELRDRLEKLENLVQSIVESNKTE